MHMIKKLKQSIRSNKFFGFLLVSAYRKVKSVLIIPKQKNTYRVVKEKLYAHTTKKRIYYIGIPAHNNLGDLAQGVCIRKWLKKHFPDRDVVEIETNALVNTRFSVKHDLKKVFNKDDIIVFQSGYTTTDLGGYADEMHCEIIKLLPGAKILKNSVRADETARKQVSRTV